MFGELFANNGGKGDSESEIGYGPLLTALTDHAKNGAYPGHMPGHKRVSLGFPDPYSIDITEIEGFDDLHHPEGLIKDLEDRIARIYGVKTAIISVNGSTAGNLACIHAAVPRRGTGVVSFERHRSVDHAMSLREASEIGLADWLAAGARAGAVIVTSPGYNGECYDIKKLSEICHERGVPLIVDAAHGAHLGFHPYFPDHPAHQGADAVITSLHKTLPAFTQTSCILIPEGSRIREREVRRWMDVFETSSPSYILMAGIERCMDYLEQRGQQAFIKYASELERLYDEARSWKKLKLRDYRDYMRSGPADATGVDYVAVDPGKLVISGDGLTGEEVAQILRSEYHVEPERVLSHEALVMTSLCDDFSLNY